MGKGTIQSHLGSGQYSVQLNLHKERVQQRIDWLTDQIAKIDTDELQKLEADLTEAQDEVDAAAQALDDLLTELENMNFWAAQTRYKEGDRLKLTARMFLKCIIGGHSGAEMPSFPPTPGEKIREDYVVWQPYRPDAGLLASVGTWNVNTEYAAGDLVSVISRDYEAKCTRGGRTGLGPNWPADQSFAYPDPEKENDKTTGPTVEDIAIEWLVVDDKEELTKLAKELMEAAAKRDEAKVLRDVLKLRLTGLEKQKEYLEKNTPVDPIIEAWCADLTTDLSGEVAVAEIPGERHQVTPLIRPGYNGAAAHDPARDGQLQPSIAGTARGVFVNWALRAAWQRWKPTYRLGTLIALDGDTCDVALDKALSSDQNLPLNQGNILSGVPIVYMTCHGAAFKVNDRVVVEFQGQDWEQPRVIGFESHPRACAPMTFVMKGHYKVVDDRRYWTPTWDGEWYANYPSDSDSDDWGCPGDEEVVGPDLVTPTYKHHMVPTQVMWTYASDTGPVYDPNSEEEVTVEVDGWSGTTKRVAAVKALPPNGKLGWLEDNRYYWVGGIKTGSQWAYDSTDLYLNADGSAYIHKIRSGTHHELDVPYWCEADSDKWVWSAGWDGGFHSDHMVPGNLHDVQIVGTDEGISLFDLPRITLEKGGATQDYRPIKIEQLPLDPVNVYTITYEMI